MSVGLVSIGVIIVLLTRGPNYIGAIVSLSSVCSRTGEQRTSARRFILTGHNSGGAQPAVRRSV
jgi:hypothetical protein